MSCPFFYPSAPRSGHAGPESAMLPLGDDWAGVCHANPEAPFTPDPAALRPLCNLGYARGNCPHFPEGAGPDAVRFTISRDDGATLRLYYVMERDHHPFAHGPLEYSVAASAFAEAPSGQLFRRQAEAYAASYLRRKRKRDERHPK